MNALNATTASDAGPRAEQVSHAPLAEAPSLFPAGLDTLQSFMAEQGSAGAINALLAYGLFAVALILLVTCALVVTDAYEEEISLILARGGSMQPGGAAGARPYRRGGRPGPRRRRRGRPGRHPRRREHGRPAGGRGRGDRARRAGR